MSLDYKKAGVDIEAGDALVHWLKNSQPKEFPHKNRLVSGIGGFSALFRAGFPEMESPCLVSATDGVGTKLKLAVEFSRYEEVGQDLVAMCVNDLICCGATPLFFLDYYATGKLELPAAKSFISGVRNACYASGCALIGGETAEMPGVYSGGDFDCAGFAVGVVDESKTLGAHKVEADDVLVAVESSGFHSNGFSLLRQVFAEDVKDWEEILMKPTELYGPAVQAALATHGVHAMAHITGGGMTNIARVLPKGWSAELDPWDLPEPFLVVKERTQMTWAQLLKTLNCGIGFVFVVSRQKQEEVCQKVQASGFRAFPLGEVTSKSYEDGYNIRGELRG